MRSLLLSGDEFLSQGSANGSDSTDIGAIWGKLEDALIGDSNFVSIEVHQVIRALQESSWGVQRVILMVVIIVLKSFGIPFHVRFTGIKFFSAKISGVGGFKPVSGDDSAAVSWVATIAAIFFLGEIHESSSFS